MCHRKRIPWLCIDQRRHQASAKVHAVLELTLPQNVKPLCNFLGMVQYYRDLWARCSEMLSPFTNLVGEYDQKPWHWDSVHQTTFDNMKTSIAKDVVLVYHDYLQEFKVCTDTSKFQLDAIMTQTILAFFSRNLNKTQHKYSMTKQDLLAIVETQKEFKGML